MVLLYLKNRLFYITFPGYFRGRRLLPGERLTIPSGIRCDTPELKKSYHTIICFVKLYLPCPGPLRSPAAGAPGMLAS